MSVSVCKHLHSGKRELFVFCTLHRYLSHTIFGLLVTGQRCVRPRLNSPNNPQSLQHFMASPHMPPGSFLTSSVTSSRCMKLPESSELNSSPWTCTLCWEDPHSIRSHTQLHLQLERRKAQPTLCQSLTLCDAVWLTPEILSSQPKVCSFGSSESPDCNYSDNPITSYLWLCDYSC